jgi:diguanylate cyclase (GGDEF)-like protein
MMTPGIRSKSFVLNRRTLFQRIDIEIARSLRLSLPLTGIMIDIDHFKRVNDNYGHLVGSRVLKEMADVIKKCLRKSDIAIRYGGDEFVLILPETTKWDA